jgi:MazG family protein
LTRSRRVAYCTGPMTQMQEPSELGRIVALVRDLRRRCPWDGAQTARTLRPYLVEEALELDEAIAGGDPVRILEELGDVLLHVAFQVVLGEEDGHFGADDLARAVERKMWRRHPHLFPAELEALGEPAAPNGTWEDNKRAETDAPHSVLDGLPPTLPALLMAFRLQERAAGVGFDWPDAEGPREKVREETDELETELDAGAPEEEVRREIGDLFFAVVNLSRKLGIDPRAAMEEANAKFATRFREVERLAAERGIEMGRATLEELDALWEEAKKGGSTV